MNYYLFRFLLAPFHESLAHAHFAAAGAARVLPSGSLDLNCRMTQQKKTVKSPSSSSNSCKREIKTAITLILKSLTHTHAYIDRDTTHPAADLIVFHTHTHSSFPALHPKNLNKTPQNIKNQIISLKKKHIHQQQRATASNAARKTIIAPPLSQLFSNHHHTHTRQHTHTRTVGLSLTPADNVDFFSCSRANLSLFDSFSICFSNFCSAVVAIAAIVVVLVVVVARELHTFLLF